MTGPAFTYSHDTKPTTVMFTSGAFGEAYVGRVVRSDGVVVHATKPMVGKATAASAAARLAPNYAHHLAKHGVCFYDQQQAERATRKAAKVACSQARQNLANVVRAGWRARAAGATLTSNPHGKGDKPESCAWAAGWMAADQLAAAGTDLSLEDAK